MKLHDSDGHCFEPIRGNYAHPELLLCEAEDGEKVWKYHAGLVIGGRWMPPKPEQKKRSERQAVDALLKLMADWL